MHQDDHRAASLRGPNLSNIGPDLVDVGPNVHDSGPSLVDVCQFGAKCVQKLHRIRAHVGRSRANFGRCRVNSGPSLVEVGQCRKEIGIVRAQVGPIRSRSGRPRNMLARCKDLFWLNWVHLVPNLVDPGPTCLVELRNIRSELGRVLSPLADVWVECVPDFGPKPAELDRLQPRRPSATRIRPMLVDAGQCSPNLGTRRPESQEIVRPSSRNAT